MIRLNTRATLPFLVIFGMIFVLCSAAVAEKNESGLSDKPELRWLRFDEGVKALEADTTGKHMFVDLTASWCGWCKKMEREAFADSKVIEAINDNFIPVRIWGDSDKVIEIEGYKISEKRLASSEFKVSGYPCFYFLTPDKKKVGPLRGYQTTDKLLDALEWVRDLNYIKDNSGAEKSATDNN